MYWLEHQPSQIVGLNPIPEIVTYDQKVIVTTFFGREVNKRFESEKNVIVLHSNLVSLCRYNIIIMGLYPGNEKFRNLSDPGIFCFWKSRDGHST